MITITIHCPDCNATIAGIKDEIYNLKKTTVENRIFVSCPLCGRKIRVN